MAGAQNLTTNFDFNNALAIGTITVPDPNPGIDPSGITGTNAVPPGAEVIAAVLYWQEVEKISQLGSGQNGFFRPLIAGGPKAPGYPISGVALGGNNTVSWSSGGCTSGSTGKAVRTYRANVLNALPRDASGNISANGTYEVRLPSTGSTTPIAIGATLVLIYRILDPSVPLNSIVIYDGDAATSATSITMMQTMQGFYDAAHNPIWRLTHIVGNGKSKKTETVSLNGQTLPSLYPGQPPFPGFYGTWDNPTWTFGNPNVPAIPNPVLEDAVSATTQVMASGANPGCQSWGAIVFSTTVKNTDGDGLLDVWKVPKAPNDPSRPGYCDAAVNEGKCTQGDANWVDLPKAKLGEKDVYVQFDYMCSSPADGLMCKTGDNTNYSFDPTLQTDPTDGRTAVDKVKAVYASPSHSITLHVNEQGNQPNVHAIQEPFCQDTMVNGQLSLCAFPHPSLPQGNTINLGVVAWPGDVNKFERQLIDPDDPTNLNDCATSPPAADCVPRFQPAAAPAKHYGLFAHAVGQPKWFIYNGSLVSVTQSDNTVTFTTSTPVGALNVLVDEKGNSAADPSCNNGRVTVIGAITNPSLDGTHCLSSAANPLGTTFTITVGGPATPANTLYTSSTDPNLAVVPPFTTTASGSAHVGGQAFVVSLGRWENPASPNSDGQNPLVIAGTIMHEGGHDWLSLAHGGPTARAAADSKLFQSVTTNCKPNYFSVMSYSRQVDGVLDYSESLLGDLNKLTQSGNLTSAGSATANWYVPWPLLDANGNQIIDPSTGKPIGSPAKLSCPGGPIPAGEHQMTRVTGPANAFSFPAAPDPNYDGNSNEVLQGECDWGPNCPGNFDLGQTGATAAIASSSGGQFGGGGPQFGGGGGQFGGGGGQFGGGGGQFGGGGGQFGGGGGQFGGGGGQFGGGGEIDLATAESITHAITDLTVVSEGASPRTITLRWTKPFGEIGWYNVYRSKNGAPFTLINVGNTGHTLAGNPPPSTFTDTVTCDPGGYRYFVTAVQSATSPFPLEESTPSNTVSTISPASDKLTGCYIVTGFSSPASAVQGSTVPITWTLQDDFYPTGGSVTRQAANTLVAIGPLPNNCTTPGRTTLLADGTPTNAADMFTNSGNQFTFTWNGTDAFCAGSYIFELDLDHVPASPAPPVPAQVQTTASALLLNIDVTDTDSAPHIPTTSLPNGVVGNPYSNALSEDGGTPPFIWTTSGSLPPGITLNSVSGILSGTPTAAGTFTFAVMVTDHAGNTGTQTLTLNVADALFGDLIVVDGSPSVVPPSGTLLRITPTGTSGTIASISNGLPDGVAVDPSRGNIYVAVAPVAGNGTPSVVKVTQYGAVSTFTSNGALQSPVAVAVDGSGNVYVGDNRADAIYKFNSSGTQVGGAFASLPSSPASLQDIRMAFNSTGNLIVASDSVGDVSGVVAVDQVDASGNVTVIYTNPTVTPTYSLTAAATASSGTTVYTGTFSPIIPVNTLVTISGFTTNTVNNGQFTVVSCTSTQLTVTNASGVAETNPATATATFILTPASGAVTLTDSVTAAAAASGGNTTYTGTFSPTIPANSVVLIGGFTNAGNNGQFTVVSCTSTQLVVNNASGVAETNSGTATFQLTAPIGFIGGIALSLDGSIDIADFAAKSIFKIANPGAATMAISTLVNGPTISATALCCNISGMAVSPSQQPNTTDLYVTLNGVGGPAAQLQHAVPETAKVTTVVNGAPLTFPNDVASYSFPGVTYYIDGNANFGTLNLGNGSTKVIGAGTVLGTGIDVTPTGQVYVDDFFNHLFQMNTSTGAATLVGTGTIPAADFYTTGGLTNGSYFAVDASSGNLYSINLSTGATTVVGLTGTATIPPGCGLETTMAGSATVIYYTIGFHDTRRSTCSKPMPDTLYAINPTNGATTTIGPVSVNGSGVNSFVGSGYVNGRLYAFTFGVEEYIIDTATGAATFVTNTTPAVFGAGSTNTGLSF